MLIKLALDVLLTLPGKVDLSLEFYIARGNYIAKFKCEAQSRFLNLVLVLRLSMVQYVCSMV